MPGIKDAWYRVVHDLTLRTYCYSFLTRYTPEGGESIGRLEALQKKYKRMYGKPIDAFHARITYYLG